MDQFVDEAFGEEAGGRGADRPPRRAGRQSLRLVARGPEIRDVVVDIPHAGGELRVRILRRRAHALEQPLEGRRRRQFEVGRDDLPLLDASRVSGDRDLPRNILQEILLARKDQLDRRSAHLVCDLGQDTDVLEFEAVSKASADPLIVKDHLFRLDADRCRRDGLHGLRALMADPDFQPLVGRNGDPVQRLERLMRHIGCAILRLDWRAILQAGVDIADLPPLLAEEFRLERRFQLLPMVGLLGGIGRGRPLAVDRLDRLHRVPAVRRDDRDAILDFEDLLDPRHRLRLARVVRFQAAVPWRGSA